MSLRPTILAAAIAAAFAAGPAQALQITTSLTGTLSKDGVPYDPSPLTTTGAAPGVISLYQPTGSYPDSGFYGDLATANTIVRVVAGGISGQITSSLVYTATVTNDTAAAIDLSFDFHIGRGRVSVAGTYDQWVWDPETESGSYQPVAFSGNASLKSEIRWGDESLWSVHLEVTDSSSTAATVINDKSASAAGFTTSDWWTETGINYDEYYGDLGLGVLNPGETKVLTYSIEGFAFYESDSGASSYGSYGGAVVGNTDPFQFEYDEPYYFPEGYSAGITAAVPEPETYALMGLGLLGVAAAARRRRRVATR